MGISGRDGTPAHDLDGGNPSPGGAVAPLSNPRPAETSSGARAHTGTRARIVPEGCDANS